MERAIRVLKSHDFRVFVVFLLIASFIWIMEKTRQNYTIAADIPITAINCPPAYTIDTAALPSIRVTITADGFTLMGIGRGVRRPVNVSIVSARQIVTSAGRMAAIDPQAYAKAIDNLLPDNATLHEITSDTIYIPLLERKLKKLPVVPRLRATLESQRIMSAPVAISPDSVTVSGTNNRIDTMTAVYTLPHPDITLIDTTTITLPLHLPEKVECSCSAATVKYFVEPYTEKSIEVPVTAINMPKGYTFKAFPQTVKVTFQLGLSQFEKVGANDIDAIADMAAIENSTQASRIKVKLADVPSFITNVSYSPLFIEYILERQRDTHQ